MQYTIKTTIVALVLSQLFLTQPLTAVAEPIPQSYIDSLSVQGMIDYLAPQYGQDKKMISDIIFCESSYRTDVSHDGGLGKGATGLHLNTFNGWTKEFHVALNYNSTFDQIRLMSMAFQKGESYRDDWSSYRRYAKYGTCDIAKIRQMGK